MSRTVKDTYHDEAERSTSKAHKPVPKEGLSPADGTAARDYTEEYPEDRDPYEEYARGTESRTWLI